MRFMIMMHAPRGEGAGDWQINNWSPEDFKRHMSFMQDLNMELHKSGEWVSGEGLASPAEAKLVRASRNGGAPITDGPFAESKEFLAGYWIVSVDNAQRAYDLAGRISAAPGRNGEPLYMAVEVRQVMDAPPRTLPNA